MLELSDVSASIGTLPILRGLSFEIGAAETVALIGRNGAGKTTLLRTIMGFTRTTGEILFDGKPIHDMHPPKRPALGIGYAPEDRRLFSAFTVEENILLPAQAARLGAAETQARLERAYSILPELRDLGQRPGGQVSGGQGKMVALARALMLGTRLLLLDEPFQGLAPALAHRYSEALRALRDADRSVTLVITESNPALLSGFADRTLVIERGEVSEGTLQPEGESA